MNEIQVIETALERAARRRRLARAFRWMWQGLFAGAALWLVTLGVYKIFPVPEAVLWTVGGLALVAVPAAFLVGWWRRPTLAETARWVDVQQRFQERLSTALEVSAGGVAGPLGALQLADAAAHARTFDVRRALPFHLPSITRWSLLLLALAAGLGFVPEYRSKEFLQRKKESEVIRDVGRNLAEVTKRSLDRRTPVLEPTEKALGSVRGLGEEFTRAKLTRSEALKELASVTEKLKDQTREMARNPALRKLEQAARSPTGQTSSASKADLQKQIESMQKQMGNPSSTPEALDKLQKELQKMQQAASGMPGSDPAAAQQQKEQLGQALSDLQKRAEELGLNLPSLDEAMKALEGSQIDKLVQDLKFAELDLQKMEAMAKALQQLQMQMAQIGKDLAEQLEKGQATAAVETLQKMIDQLKTANLTPEQMKKLLEEVERGAKPGSEYGKVGELLKAAAGQMQKGEKSGAAESLAAASDELKKLMDQMGDAQAMMAALDSLQRAQMCVGNSMSWGQCKGPPRAGKGGKPGRGVGTWADENGWLSDYVEQTDRWDNSGIERPDTAARGLTDRGEGETRDGLVPTKVKGQMSPGGQMPSITLKGVSIKGQSRVEYQEAVVAAQSAAQGALSQEQVPRAYQGAVRDYFDDLKE